MAIGTNTVCVQGIEWPDGTLLDEALLRMFFESSRNGGKISALEIDHSGSRAWITFADLSTADKVLKQKNFKFMDFDFVVTVPEDNIEKFGPAGGDGAVPVTTSSCPLGPGSMDRSRPASDSTQAEVTSRKRSWDATADMTTMSGSNVGLDGPPTVLVENVPKAMDEDDLELLIEHPKKGIEMDGNIVSVEIDRATAVAVVNFSSISDAQKLLDKGFLEHKQKKMAVKKQVIAHPSAVLVTGITDALDEDTLDLYFSNPKKSCGDDIVKMQFFDPGHGFAVIEYADAKVAEAVIHKQTHVVRKVNLIASPWIPGEEKNICRSTPISHPPSTCSPKMVQSCREPASLSLSYQESPRVSHLNSESPSYSNVKKMPDVEDHEFRSERDLKHVEQEEEMDSGQEEKVKTCTILVEGLTTRTKDETIRRFFQSRGMSGGGSIESVSKVDKGSYLIVFKDPACVDRVLKRDRLTLDDTPISVKEISAPSGGVDVQGPTEPLMIYVFGDLVKLTRDALTLYLEEVASAGIGDVIYGTEEGAALIVFKNKFDYRALRREVLRKPVEDVMLGIRKVVCSPTVQVYSVKPKEKFVLKMYFESERNSGGSGEVRINSFSEHAHLVQFQNPGIANRVAKRRHYFDDEELMVTIYREALGLIPPGYDTSKPSVKIPTHKIIEVDPLVIKYVKESKGVAESANTFLKRFHGRIDLTHAVEGEIKIICELQDTEHTRSLAEKWDGTIMEGVRQVVSAFDRKSVECLPKFWNEIYSRLQEYKKTITEVAVMIVESEDTHSVEVIGPVQYLKDVLGCVREICQDVQEIKEQVTEDVEAPIGKLLVLQKMGIKDELKEKWPKISVQVDKKDEKMVLKGKPTDILLAMKIINKQLKNLDELEVPMSKLKINVISSPEGWSLIQKQLKKNELVTEIECDTDKMIIIGPKDQIRKTETLIKEEIVESAVPISEDSQAAIRGKEWEQFIQKHLKKNSGKLHVEMSHDRTTIKIAAAVDLYDQFKEHLMNYLKDNTVKKKFIRADGGRLKLLKRDFQKDLKQIEMDFVNFGVQVMAQQEDGKESGFTVSGVAEGFMHAVTRVEDLISDVVSDSQIIRQPGLPKFLMSESSTMILCGVENTCEVVIEVNDIATKNAQIALFDEADQEDAKPKMKVLDSVHAMGTTVKVIVGDLTEHSVDAVVNPANQRLQHSGGLAGALVQKGGRTIQQESNTYIQLNDNLRLGDAMITRAGTLPCKRLIHTVGPHWSGGRAGEEDVLYDCVDQCLKLAKKEDLRTIAFPAIGTGIFAVPVDVSATAIVEAIYDYLHIEDDVEITEIHLVDEDKKTAESFAAALKTKFGTTDKTKRARLPRLSSSKDVSSAAAQASKDETAAAVKVGGSTFSTKEGIKVILVKGEIAHQKTNAIVNSVPSNLRLSSGALSGSIMAAMDDANQTLVQTEALQKNRQSVAPGSVVTTTAGNLASSVIFHIVLSGWNGAASVQLLEGALDKILTGSHQRGFTSLAIPAVGTGNLKWPADIVASTFFDAVIKFSGGQPNTPLKTVHFVVYPADTKSVAAFEGHLQKLGGVIVSGQPDGRRTERKLAVNRGLDETEMLTRGAEGGAWVDLGREILPASPDVGELQIGRVKLQVTTGDITRETTDAIVNSTNARLDLTMGGVSKALATAGGNGFVRECQEAGGVRPKDVTVTGSGKMKCKFVIHFDANMVDRDWRNIIKTCLRAAESKGLRSLTFPALGTGMRNQRPEVMAMSMMEAIADFANGGAKNVTLVRVVIFQLPMLQPYFSQMEEVSRGRPSVWGRFKRFIGYEDAPPEQPKPSYYSGGAASNFASNFERGVSLDVYAYKDKNKIVRAVEAIDKLWAEQKADQILGGPRDQKLKDVIKKLDSSEIAQIETLGQHAGVRVTVEAKRKAAQIRIQGQLKDAAVVESNIRKYLHQIEMQEHEKEEAQILCQFVQWEFQDKHGAYTPYPENMNGLIEKAYARKTFQVTWSEEQDGGGQRSVVLDLRNMTETVEGGIGVTIRRRDLSQQVGYKVPDNWSPMNQGDRFVKVTLKPTDQEYIDVAKAFQQTARNYTIVQIERLQNPTLYRRYVVHKMDMEAERPNVTSERWLWHGTVPGVINNINTNGFNRSYNGTNATAFGKGVYFARYASYSVGYAKPDASGQRCMYYAYVLTGEYCVGNQRMLEPPPKNAAQPNILYDSTVDNQANPTIFVVYIDTQVYPHYLVTFK